MKETEKHIYSKKIPLVSMPCLFYGHSAHFALPIQRGIRRLVFWGGGGWGGVGGGGMLKRTLTQDTVEKKFSGKEEGVSCCVERYWVEGGTNYPYKYKDLGEEKKYGNVRRYTVCSNATCFFHELKKAKNC
jgi:hypothetical protein